MIMGHKCDYVFSLHMMKAAHNNLTHIKEFLKCNNESNTVFLTWGLSETTSFCYRGSIARLTLE